MIEPPNSSADPLDIASVREANQTAWSRHAPAWAASKTAVLAEGSLISQMDEWAEQRPSQAVLEIAGEGIARRELTAATSKVARWLAGRGVGPGTPVMVAAGNSLPMVVAYLGALRAGASVVLANPALTRPELRHMLRDSGAVVAFGARPVQTLAGLRDETSLDEVVDLDGGLAAILRDRDDGVFPVADRGGAPLVFAYTSGTTGTPKAVGLGEGNLLASIRGAMLAWDWHEDDVLVHALPLYHQHGLGGVHAALLSGSRTVVLAKFDPTALAATLARESASVLFAVPTIYERLIGLASADAAAFRSLRLLVSGSAPLSPALATAVAESLGQQPLERYGTTESGLDVSNPLNGPRRVGSVGLALPGVELAIADPAGRPLGPGEEGEIVLRGPQVFAGYRGDVAEDPFYPGGWFRTGDIGVVGPDDGYLCIVGRSKELIITGGLNVYPREVELALEADPLVAEAAVVGLPSERWGEEVVAAVVATGVAPDAEEVIGAARDALAPYKCPKRVVVLDDLPRNPMGKIVRADVLAAVEEALG